MMYLTMSFWTCDIAMSLLTGYQSNAQVILKPSLIARKYLRTWLLMDLGLVSMDYAVVALGTLQDSEEGSALRVSRMLRTLRFVRTLRLLRLMKLKRVLQDIQDQINSEFFSICFSILKIVLCLVIANHVVACLWYAVGTSVEATPSFTSWVLYHEVAGKPLVYRYMTSLHWSLTQFTPASMEVFPHNSLERTFSVTVLLIAMISFSSFVSILTALIAELRKISSDETRQFWLLRRYLRDWSVDRAVALKVRRYLEYAYAFQRQRVQAKDVQLLSLLSEPLRDEMRHAQVSANLVLHPLFRQCNTRIKLFSKALVESGLARGDLLFACGEEAKCMYFLAWGRLSYSLGHFAQPLPGSPSSDILPNQDEEDTEHLYEGHWVSEPVLWVEWLHLGDAQACTECQLLAVPKDMFSEAIASSRPLFRCLREYAARFVDYLNRLADFELTDLTHQVISSQEIIDEVDFTKHGIDDGPASPSDSSRSLAPGGRSPRHAGLAGQPLNFAPRPVPQTPLALPRLFHIALPLRVMSPGKVLGFGGLGMSLLGPSGTSLFTGSRLRSVFSGAFPRAETRIMRGRLQCGVEG